ncbi:MAG: efflux RND transporter permease subunit [Acidiferrobacter sp.]
MDLIRYSLRSAVLVLGIAAIVVGVSVVAWESMPINVFPEFAPPRVVIGTQVPGLAPTDMEALVTYPVETAIGGVPGVKAEYSKSSVGLSVLTVVFRGGTNIYHDRQLVAERLADIRARLPQGTVGPTLFPLTSAVGWLVKYALTGPGVSATRLRTIADWQIRPRLLAVPGVASVSNIGGGVRQYQLYLDPARLLAFHLSPGIIRQSLTGLSRDVAAGFLERPAQELIMGGQGRIRNLAGLRDSLVAIRGGVPIPAYEVGTVRKGHAIRRGAAALGLLPAVVGTVYKSYGANTLSTTDRVLKALRSARAALPYGVALDTHVFRQATFITAAIHNLKQSLWQGAIIVIIVLFVFLANWRASLATFLSIPLSFAGGALILYAFHAGVNSMTLGGFAIALGEVVDNGIVTVENVVHRLRDGRLALELGQGPQDPMFQAVGETHRGAAIASLAAEPQDLMLQAVREVMGSVVYATLIIILIFLPIFFLQGLGGRIFRPLGIAYVATIIASLVVAVTAVPALCYLLLGRFQGPQAGHFGGRETGFVRLLKRGYQRILEASVGRFRMVMALSVAGLVVAGLLSQGLGRSFLPAFHEGDYIIVMTGLPGTSWRESMRLGRIVRQDLMAFPQVVSVDQRAGSGEITPGALTPNNSEFDVRIDFHKGHMTPDALLAKMRTRLSHIPGVAFNIGEFIAHRIDDVESGVAADVAVKVFGPRLRALYHTGAEIQSAIRPIKGVVDLHLEQQLRVPQLTVQVRRRAATRLGIPVARLLADVQIYLNGVTVGHVIRGRQRFAITLRVRGAARANLRSLKDLPIRAPRLGPRAVVPLREVARVRVQNEPFLVRREDGHRVLLVTFNVSGRPLSAVIRAVKARIGARVHLPRGYVVRYGGTFRSQQRADAVLMGLGILAVFAALLLLHQAFGSFRDALIVLMNLPLALIGGVVALVLAHATLSVAAVIGFVTLFGIAARNGIILMSRYRALSEEGLGIEEVVRLGSLDRLVPILMTAATAALGLLPLLFGSPVGKELERPLAEVVLGGLVTSTMLNLIVIPSAYHWFVSKGHTRAAQKTI